MVLSVRRWTRRIVFIVLLALFTIVMYNGCRYIAVWIAPEDPYRVPQGSAEKVFRAQPAPLEENTLSDRLRLFYWYGE
ncbi:YqzK family protein [Paenibacillus oenotherae]|uniref:YqzK family protein n=1 Tax=Paenibacillus oenotherae TaxID=1435645 RepID=A0ABS7D0U8_9BACL|nr:DUF4227 family protein [Paenibacillus oenotherae]MBW7473519.1 YqzK family protein [Paenibacillus oenotherae]